MNSFTRTLTWLGRLYRRVRNSWAQRSAVQYGWFILGLVLSLPVFWASSVDAALPSRVLQLRDKNEEIAIGLGESQGSIRISSTEGLEILTADGKHLTDVAKAISITAGKGRKVERQQTVWRVQVKAVRDEQAAWDLKGKVEAEAGMISYVLHEEPWYKIQVGDAASLAEAEVIKEKIIGLGYEDAWISKAEAPVADAVSDDSNSIIPTLSIEDGIDGNLLVDLTRHELVVAPKGKEPLALQLSGSPLRKYRGRLRLTALGQNQIRVVNLVGLEEYLYGVVGAELYSNSKEEQAALAAQAVAARTYTIQNLGKHEGEGYDLCATVHCQVYQGVERESELIRKAVDTTWGQILVYGGQAISAVYHSSSGGATAGAEQVWATRYSGYLRPVPDEVIDPATETMVKLGQDRPGYKWEITWQADELSDILQRHLAAELSIKVPVSAVLKDLRVDKTDPLGRVERLIIVYEDETSEEEEPKSEYLVTKDKIRWVLRKPDGSILPSTRFELETHSSRDRLEKVSVVGQGNGHGLGLSQAGALHMSRLGYGYEEILYHYYTDVTLLTLGQYYEHMESMLVWENKGFVQTWAAILGSDHGVNEHTDVLQWSPAGDLIAYGASGAEGGLWVFNTITGERATVLQDPVREIAWKSDGSAVAVVTATQRGRRQLQIIPINISAMGDRGSLSPDLLAEGADIHSPTWLPGSDLVLFGQNGMVYGGVTKVSVPLLTGATVPEIAPSGKQMVFYRNGAVWLYNLITGAVQQLYAVDSIKSVFWSPNGRHLAVALSEEVLIIDVQSRELIIKLTGSSPAWSAHGEYIAYVDEGNDGLCAISILEVASLEKHVLANVNQGNSAVHLSNAAQAVAYINQGRLHLLTWR
ncbi:MAG: SpoIID/LytB domain-containing protein [Firmicutes bacterium]|nr:SpoIID/LytB domain-containing protein [Bacillota bacterium]